ncbi:glycosyltransferase family 4 protein [Algibacter lectus]|uniref:glycosyltransferase family 4 protein n=1 Tax=Algibacter lectus TaxID=221126 RepID=UPI0026EA6441|nr:glycosyltransferase family 1 protein [Algibacter lectus]MDO7137091.1 glycosyltransferase family 1 protein [Algibacter lectus]
MIIINARFLTQPITGVQRFAIEISKELVQLKYPVVFVAPSNIIHKDLAKLLNVVILPGLQGHFWEQISLPFYVLRKRGLLVSLCNLAPLILKKQIIAIHDLSALKHPEWFSKAFNNFYRFVIPILAKRARHIITVSETSKKELIDYLKIFENKISVVHNAVFNIGTSMCPSVNKEDYILTVSSHNPRKNFERLIKAFNLIENKKIRLIVVGNFSDNFKETNFKFEDHLNERVEFLTNIDDAELITYYQKAKLFVFPSLYEGYGIPVLEAIMCETECLVSDIPVFKEIYKDSVNYFNPKSVSSITEQINNSLNNPKTIKETLVIKKKMDLKFSWSKSAIKIISIINFNYETI